MEIMNSKWNSLTCFDDKLLEIEVYKNHPTLLPFVGRHYESTRILLLGESHYLDSSEDETAKKMEGWYCSTTESYSFKYPENVDTRLVVHNYLNARRSKAHSMFGKPAEALIEAWNLENVNDSEAFTTFAFMNYFQRPEANAGKSISLNEEDKTVAYMTLNEVIKILEPKLILFLSKKAYDCYKELAGDKVDSRTNYVYHPTSKYWNEDNGKNKAVQCFNIISRYNGFAKNGKLLQNKIRPILDDKNYFVVEKRHKRFFDDKITVSIYPEKDKDSVSEIVWHVKENNISYGIGYVVERKTIWLWSYTDKKYFTEAEMKENSELKKLYKEVIEIIKNLPEY